MDFLEELSEHHALALVVMGVALGVFVALRALRGTRDKMVVPGYSESPSAGCDRDTAMRCLREGRLEEALELFLRADELTRAALVAQRLGRDEHAAMLFERGGELRMAAACYERMGQLSRANEVLAMATTRGAFAVSYGAGDGSSQHHVAAETTRRAPRLDSSRQRVESSPAPQRNFQGPHEKSLPRDTTKDRVVGDRVEGDSVERLIAIHGRLPLHVALDVTLQVLQVLERAHGQGVVHRDVKPANMVRTTTGAVTLVNFTTVGVPPSITTGYMAPERLDGSVGDHRADLYAVGVSLYEMLTAALPFAPSAGGGAVPSVRAVVPYGAAVLDEVLRQALDADPTRRFQSARALTVALQKVAEICKQSPWRDDLHGKPTSSRLQTVPFAHAAHAVNPHTLEAHMMEPTVSNDVPFRPTTSEARTMKPAVSSDAPSRPTSGRREATHTLHRQTMLLASVHVAETTVSKRAEVTRDVWSLPPAAPQVAPQKKGTMLMQSGPSDRRRDASRATAASTNPAARKTTMMLSAVHTVSRRTSTIPPSA